MRHYLIRNAIRAASFLLLACVVGFPAPIAHADVGVRSDPPDDSDDIAPDAYLAGINTFGYWRTDKVR